MANINREKFYREVRVGEGYILNLMFVVVTGKFLRSTKSFFVKALLHCATCLATCVATAESVALQWHEQGMLQLQAIFRAT